MNKPFEVKRRQVLTGLAGLPLATILSDPSLARQAAESLAPVSITTKESGKKIDASLALPARTPAPAILLIHEWWGLNDQIKSVAAELAKRGYVALAVDLYDGKVAQSRDKAGEYMNQVEPAAATETLESWLEWLKEHEKVEGGIGTIGWCFGGGWSLNASLAEPVDATVIYYGNVDRSVAQLQALDSPVLGHFATRDGWINEEMVAKFEENMAQAGKALTVYWYEADHAFANPSGARYDQEDAQLAWQRTLDFFRQHLG